jgi:hypothetical protein
VQTGLAFFGFLGRHLRVGWHVNHAPSAVAALAHLERQALCGTRVLAVFVGHGLKSRTHHLFVNGVAGQAVF